MPFNIKTSTVQPHVDERPFILIFGSEEIFARRNFSGRNGRDLRGRRNSSGDPVRIKEVQQFLSTPSQVRKEKVCGDYLDFL